jgi:hypothetical protein
VEHLNCDVVTAELILLHSTEEKCEESWNKDPGSRSSYSSSVYGFDR